MNEPADFAAYRKLKLDTQARNDLAVGGMPSWLFDQFVKMGEYNNQLIKVPENPALSSMDIYASDVPGQYHWLVCVEKMRVFSIALTLHGQILPDGAVMVSDNDPSQLPTDEQARAFGGHFIEWMTSLATKEVPPLVQMVNAMGLSMELFFHATQIFQRTFDDGDTQFIYRLKEDYTATPGWSACLTLYTDSLRQIGDNPTTITETP